MARYEVYRDGKLSEDAAALVDKNNYAVLATYSRNGNVHQSVLWVLREGDELLFSTVEGRTKHKNVVRDPRAHVLIYDRADPEQYVEAAGMIEVIPDANREFSNRVSRKYTGRDHTESDARNVRVILRLRPSRSAYRTL